MKQFDIEDFPSIGGVMASKMVTEENHKPNFIFREKPFFEADSGWRIFSGCEDDEYSDNSDNFGIYDARTILKIDDSISQLLLYKGVGSVWERTEDSEWQEVFDYPLEDDFMVEYQLTENWSLPINNLFIRQEEEKDLMFTTNDKTLRLGVWNYTGKTKDEILKEKEQDIETRKSEINIIRTYKFEQNDVLKIGYLIREYDEYKDYEYNLLCSFSIVDDEILQKFFYFDDEKDIQWALETWKNIEYKK